MSITTWCNRLSSRVQKHTSARGRGTLRLSARLKSAVVAWETPERYASIALARKKYSTCVLHS